MATSDHARVAPRSSPGKKRKPKWWQDNPIRMRGFKWKIDRHFNTGKIERDEHVVATDEQRLLIVVRDRLDARKIERAQCRCFAPHPQQLAIMRAHFIVFFPS